MNFFSVNLFIYIRFLINLIILVNPVAMIPIFISLTNHQTIQEKNKTNLITNLVVFIILSLFLLLGNQILDIFGISMSSFKIAGGLLLLIISISMIEGTLSKNLIKKSENNSGTEEKSSENLPIVPLAIPLIAGPGAISSSIIWGSQYSEYYNLLGGVFSIFIFSILCIIIFKLSSFIKDIIKETGIMIITRITGLLIMALGVEFVLSSINTYFNGMHY